MEDAIAQQIKNFEKRITSLEQDVEKLKKIITPESMDHRLAIKFQSDLTRRGIR